MAYDWQQGISRAGTGAVTGSMFGPWGAAIGGGLGLLSGMFGGGGDEYEAPEWYYKQLPETAQPQLLTGREGAWQPYTYPTYPWAEPLLAGGARHLTGLTGSLGRGEIPDYLMNLGESLRGPAMQNLRETYFGGPMGPGVAGLAGEAAATAGLGRGGRSQYGIGMAGREFGRAATGIEGEIAKLLGTETSALARQLPGWLSTMGQIKPPTTAQFLGPEEQWWTPAVYGFVGGGEGGGTQDTDAFNLGSALPWMMAGRTGGEGNVPGQDVYGGTAEDYTSLTSPAAHNRMRDIYWGG